MDFWGLLKDISVNWGLCYPKTKEIEAAVHLIMHTVNAMPIPIQYM